jgi:hypothetical protein
VRVRELSAILPAWSRRPPFRGRRSCWPCSRASPPSSASIAAVLCGHRCGLPNLIVLGITIVLWLGLLAGYAWQARGRRDPSRTALDHRAAVSATAGFGVPFIVSAVLWRSSGFDGLVFTTDAAAFCAVLFTVFFAAILASSMVDWYYVLPKALGVTGPPIWLTNTEAGGDLGKERRRNIAQVWIFHRGVCELLTLSCVALLAAILLVAAGHALSGDHTLPAAIEALGGSGIAVGILQYLGPRLRDGLNFVLSSPVGLGMWVHAEGEDKRERTGLVVDVSIAPGVKLVTEDGERFFIPLAQSHLPSPATRPDGVTRDRSRALVEEHLGRDAPRTGGTPWPTRLLRRLLLAAPPTPDHVSEDDARWDAA